MPIFKTSLKVEATGVNFTSTNNTDLTDDVVFGKISVNSNSPSIINPDNPGAKGSFLYVKSSASNPKHTAINIYHGMGQELITLHAGEYTAIALSKEISSLYASTTHETAELEYFFGSRGDEIGESIMFNWQDQETGNWKFFTLDAATGKPNQVHDTGVNYGDFPNIYVMYVNNKGYCLRFSDGQGGLNTNNFLLFINSDGEILTTISRNGDQNMYYGRGKANLITGYDGSVVYAFHFDGENVYEHEFPNVTDYNIEYNWDECSADGTFPLYIIGHDGTSNEATFLIKGGDKTLIKTTNPAQNWSNSYTYSFGNFIAVETVTEGNQYDVIETLEIFSTDGTLLKSVNIGGLEASTKDYYFYGSGKMQVVFKDDNNAGNWIFLNYNQLTGKLIGEDLTWTSNYNNIEVICNQYYSGGAVDYKPESVAIIMDDDAGNDTNSFLQRDTDGNLEVTYIMNNDLEQRNYIVPSTENNYRVTGNVWNFLHSTNKDFVLLSADNRTTGPLVATRFTSGAEPTRFNLINDLSTYNVSDVPNQGYINSQCFGDYRFIGIRSNIGNTNKDVIIYDSKVLDKITVYWDDWDWNYNSNSIYITDYDNDKDWYFNTSTKKWVQFSQYYDGNYWSNWAPGDKYPTGDGKIVLLRYQNAPTSATVYGRVITRGVAGNEKELLKVQNISNFWGDFGLINIESFVWMYQETETSTWKAKVFDLNLNFLYEIDTELTSIDNSWEASGKISTIRLPGSNDDWTFYNFNRMLNKQTVNNPNASFWSYINNYGWD